MVDDLFLSDLALNFVLFFLLLNFVDEFCFLSNSGRGLDESTPFIFVLKFPKLSSSFSLSSKVSLAVVMSDLIFEPCVSEHDSVFLTPGSLAVTAGSEGGCTVTSLTAGVGMIFGLTFRSPAVTAGSEGCCTVTSLTAGVGMIFGFACSEVDGGKSSTSESSSSESSSLSSKIALNRLGAGFWGSL